MGRRLSISFDLDGTLTNNRFVDSVWLEGLPNLVAERQKIDFTAAQRMCTDAYSGVGDGSILWYQLPYWLEHFDLKDADPKSLVTRYASHIELYDDVLPVLKGLKQEGFDLILFSNAARDFLDLEVFQGALEPFFNRIISVSDDWGMVKAQADSFTRLRETVAGELVHIGDHKRFDYEVPMSIGITAYHIRRDNAPAINSSLHTLHQFAEIVLLQQ